MYTIKGFISYHALTDNVYGRTSPVGELSSYSRTFSRDIGDFTDIRWDGVHFQPLSSKNNGVTTPVSPVFQETTLEIAKWVIDKTLTASATYSRSDFLVDLQMEFEGRISTMNAGEIYVSGQTRIPEWVSWKLEGQSLDNEVRIWFVDEALQRDYDESEIVVIQPVQNVDVFFRPVTEIQAALSIYNASRMMELVNDARNRQPETIIRCEILNVRAGSPTWIEIPTSWYVLVYGPRGDDPDQVREAIKNHILSKSADTEDNWKTILPDLFRVTQMFVLPTWHKVALPQRQLIEGIYSPIMMPSEVVSHATTNLPDLATAHITDNVQMTHHKYRSIGLVVVGGEDNKDSLFKLTDYTPDYIAEGTSSNDFNRQSEFTKTWTKSMEEMLVIAEKATDTSLIGDSSIRRVTRNGIKFLSRKIGKVEWLMTRKNQG